MVESVDSGTSSPGLESSHFLFSCVPLTQSHDSTAGPVPARSLWTIALRPSEHVVRLFSPTDEGLSSSLRVGNGRKGGKSLGQAGPAGAFCHKIGRTHRPTLGKCQYIGVHIPLSSFSQILRVTERTVRIWTAS